MENEYHFRKGEENLKKVTIKISKKITHYYNQEKRILIPYSEKKICQEPEEYFQFKLQLVLPEIILNKKQYVKKILTFLSPKNLADRIIELKNQNPKLSLKKILSDAEYKLIEEVSTKIIGSDDDPVKIYDFLSMILKETSNQIDLNSKEFTLQLSRELYNKGIEF